MNSSRLRSSRRHAVARLLRAATSSGKHGSSAVSPGASIRPYVLVKSTATRRPRLVSTDETLALESTQVISRLPRIVRCFEQRTNSRNQLTICEPLQNMAEPYQGGQDCHHTRVSEAESRSMKTVFGSRRSGHLRKGGHIGGRLCVCCFGVTESPVGGFANCPEGMPVLTADATPDPEIVRIADDCFGSERPPLFEVLLDPRCSSSRALGRLPWSARGYGTPPACGT